MRRATGRLTANHGPAAAIRNRNAILPRPMANAFFALTEQVNSDGVIALLASGQAVVFYRIALMSKDGDWVLRETLWSSWHGRSITAPST